MSDCTECGKPQCTEHRRHAVYGEPSEEDRLRAEHFCNAWARPSEWDLVLPAAVQLEDILATVRLEGVAEERGRIVAWLLDRAGADEFGARYALLDFRRRIEAGEHEVQELPNTKARNK